MFKHMKLGTKLLFAFLLVGIIPLSISGIATMVKSGDALHQRSFDQLVAIREIKKAQIEKFFAECKGDMGVLMETVATLEEEAFNKLSAVQELKKTTIETYIETLVRQVRTTKEDPVILTALGEMNQAFHASGKRVDSAQWQEVARKYDKRFKGMVKDNGWYDLFLIHIDGNIVYTAARESDLGMSIPDSVLSDTGIGIAFKRSRTMGADQVAIADFEPYAPSNGAQAGFMMAQIRDEANVLKGFVAIQIPTDTINAVMQQRAGMGKSGESYLVGRRNGESSFRSDMKTMGDGKYVIGYAISTPYIEKALEGESGSDVFTDSAGHLVMVAFNPLKLEGLQWACVSKIDLEETISPKLEGSDHDFYTDYIQKYGYYDLFLIHPKGEVFYSVTHEADYGTNMINGKYAESGLGRLTREVLETRSYGFADFAPYAPSNGEPAAFIAQPFVGDGKLKLVVALQLSLEAINAVMTQRDGMGQSGETYLVGPDKLMRSDSFLDPENHSVKASFANPVKGKVDTDASRKALAGNSGAEIIIDYNGNPVLSAYAPVTVGKTVWGLLAEIDEVEAFAAVTTIKWFIGVLAVVCMGAIIAVALLITRSITKPINFIIKGLTEGSEQVAAASNQVSSSSQSLAEGSSEQAASVEETSSSLEEISSMTRQNADNANQAHSLMNESSQIVSQADNSMRELLRSMGEISKASEETSKIIKTIDEIAFQTNLLALNAAVEAARAGEAGAGFAVVADEVRNLAIRAAEASKNTARLIDDTVSKVNGGSDLMNKTNEAFAKVAQSTEKVGKLVNEIAAASSEQSQGINQVNTAVNEVDKVTQQNAANAEETASAAEEMSAQAQQMLAFVNDLVGLIEGSANGRHIGSSRHAEAAESKGFALNTRTVKADKLHTHVIKKAAPSPVHAHLKPHEFDEF